ncbi:MAG TPA: universal stress protein [Chitinophagaceae bacterium]
MKKILVPTDFSKNAMKAALYASEIAQRTGAQVHFLHSVGVDEGKFSSPGTVYERYANLVLEDAKDELKTFRHAVKKVYKDVSYRTALAGNDSVVNAIAKYILKHEFDLVVMGTKGRKGLASVFGSVTSAVISKVPLPVLAVPIAAETEKPKDIVLATDHFETDHHLLIHVIGMAKLFRTRLHIVSFVHTRKEAVDYMETGRKLQNFADYVKKTWPEIEVVNELLEGDHFEYALERYCMANHIGMIAVIPQGKNFFQKITGNSASRNLALHGDTPVLNIKGNEN